MTRYQHLANLLAERIEQGLYRSGERLPSVRTLSQEHGVSISTIQQAYQILENLQLITPQPRSGYFVSKRKAQPPVPAMTRPVQRPVDVTQWDEVMMLLDARADKEMISFGGGSPDINQPSLKPLWREMSRIAQHNPGEMLSYDVLDGRLELREQIARLMLDGGSTVAANEIVITNGCHGALSIALLSVCKPGDIVAVESPSFHGTMQMLRGFNIKAIEIPTDPETGISIEALELALEQWPIKAVILVPNCNNPLGFIMPEARKKQVLALAQRHDIVIVEDDIYGELAAEYPRPRTIHSMDIDGRVLLCSSFTKTVAPGLRVGWIVPGRYYDRVMHMKYAAGGFNVPGTQMAVAAFIRDGHYHRHVRRMRQIYQQNMETYTCWVRQYFPAEICVTRPQGSFLLWVELPETVDMVCVSKQLCRLKIQAAAGSLFSASGKYRNCLRINVALPPTDKNREALKKMGEAIAKEAKKEQISIVLGCGINIKRSPLCGRNFEYFSEDPYLTGKLATGYIEGVQSLGIGTSLKHYAVNSQETRRMTSNSQIDERTLREIYLSAFEEVVKKAKPTSVMASYNRINGEFGARNKYLLTDVLRKEWKYQGGVVSDWGAANDIVSCMKNGLTLEMPDPKGFHTDVLLLRIRRLRFCLV